MPGFDALTIGRAQLWSFGSAKTFGPNTVNDFHASLTHNANNVGVPNGGKGVTLAPQGFVTGPGTPGIVVLAPQFEGVENLVFNTFTMGVTITGVNQTGDTLHLADSVSKVLGAHTVKFGGQYQFQQVRLEPNATFNGTFTFAGTETGSDFADFLLGVPSNYIQSSGGVFYLRNQYGGVFAQDSWRARVEPDDQLRRALGHHGAVVREGQSDPDDRPGPAVGRSIQMRRSASCSPTDTGIARGLSPARFGNISPRLGVAYSPNEKTSLRASYGLFYTAFQGLSAGIMYGVPPYGYNYLSPAPPLFETPFITAADGTNNGQRFPQQFPPLNASAEQPHDQHRLLEVPPGERRSVLRRDQQDAVLGEFHVLGSARAGAEHGRHGQLRRHARPQHARAAAGEPRRSRVLPQREPGEPGRARAARRADRSARTASTRARTARCINGTRTALGPDYGTSRSRRRSATRATTALELNLRYAKGPASVLAGYTYSKSVDVVVESRRAGESLQRRAVRSAVGLRHAPQLRRQLQLRAAVRAAVQHGATR